jgi:lipoprotein-anchoring transpeptidase ErfK/SrfK
MNQFFIRTVTRFATLAVLMLAAAVASADTIHIWKGEQLGYFNGYYFNVAIGNNSTPTPTGSYRVKKKVVDYWSKKYDRAMPYAVFFTDAHAIHRGDLSTRSHGCIRVDEWTAPWLYYYAETGKTRVVVHP